MTCPAPLDGLVVAELGERIGAGVCGLLLAQLGAKIIVPEAIESKRSLGAFGKQRYRDQMLAGKLSVVLRSDGSDVTLVDRLVARSDVVILSSDLEPAFRPGAWPGADHRVECDVTAFGLDGPLAGQPYSDAQIQAISGIIDTTGMPDAPPTPIGLPLVEFMTGVYAAAACLAALRVRKRDGIGQAIDMALYDCAFAAMSTFLPRLLDGSGANVGRVGNRHAMASPWNVYRARDGWVLVCAASDHQWRRICEVVGRPDRADDPRYLRVSDRVARHGEVDGIVAAWVAQGTIAQCVDAFGRAGVPCGPVTQVDGYPREANLDHRGMVLQLPASDGAGTVFVPASPLRMSLTPGISPARIPHPDEDRAAILTLLDSPPTATRSPDRRAATSGLPLSGIRVLEIGHYTTAPLSARHLANLGADVIKIEPADGEAVRGWPPARKGTGYFFVYTNADKRSLTLDLESQDGAAVLADLIRRSDVLLENLKPGALAKRGFTSEAIAVLNPRLIYCAVSGFGAHSIYAGRPAFDMVIQAMSGFMDLTKAGGVPVKSGISSADLMGAEIAVVAILGALEARDRSGRGQSIDLSMQDAGAWITSPFWNGGHASPQPVASIACDGFVVVEPDETEPHAIKSDAKLTRAALSMALNAAGRRAAPILTAREAVQSEQTSARHLVFEGTDSAGDVWPLLGSPLRLLGTPPVVSRPMGPLGSDGAAIRAELAEAGEPTSVAAAQ